jgi:cell division septal protein FtsQ
VGDRATLAALGVLASLSPELRATVAGLSAATAYDVTLFLTGGGSVIWGSDSDAAAKNASVTAMLQTTRGAAGQVLDVSDPTLVTVRSAP